MRCVLVVIGLTLTVGIQAFWGTRARAQEAREAEQAASISEQLEASRTWPQFRQVDEPSRQLEVATILKYTNVTRVLNPEEVVTSLVLLCVDEGRPVAAIQVFAWDGNVCHELDYLARQPGYVAAYEGPLQWRPISSGIKFQALPAATAPAAEASRRMLQMKGFARRFRCTLTGWNADNSDRQTLRLMPRALYRYRIDTAPQRGSFDGAVFAFAQGTDPEALLLIEAVRDSQGEHWEYAFCRATSGGLQATLGDAVVWRAEKDPASHPQLPHFTYRRRLEVD
ncbi:hypothetical protein [Roseimaritima ulvae]|uniref:Uncharacterized protein n=1 Tax=Roseimaritima ulvae TaxID=980254 RepID=A0A5B9QUK5_9BACT|nr:hypothetical protein [Roseimaritima ulvae]QEG41450.1 hypothetical protein UC8_34710 [Roseimaritima ulvae]